MATIGQMIKMLRKEKELTQKELGDKIGVSAVTITRYENEQRYPDIKTIKALANALGVSVSQIVDVNLVTASSYPELKPFKPPKSLDEIFDELLESLGYEIIDRVYKDKIEECFVEIYSVRDKISFSISLEDYMLFYSKNLPIFIASELYRLYTKSQAKKSSSEKAEPK